MVHKIILCKIVIYSYAFIVFYVYIFPTNEPTVLLILIILKTKLPIVLINLGDYIIFHRNINIKTVM